MSLLHAINITAAARRLVVVANLLHLSTIQVYCSQASVEVYFNVFATVGNRSKLLV